MIQKCDVLGKQISKGIKDWGVSILGNDDELNLTDMGDEDSIGRGKSKGGYFTEKPKLLAEDLTLKNYQQVGINWLALLYKKGLSCILADEMGLGKTCQVIAFLAHLKETGTKARHLIVVPSSTIENWLREFQRFCPSLVIEPYYGSQSERAEIREMLSQEDVEYDVMVTTYNLACGNKNDIGFLKYQQFNVCVYDEGHMLKNSQSERYSKLMKIKADFRLLLTGTPLQNNLRELVSLLAFILPSIFQSRKEDLEVIFKHKAKATDHDEKSDTTNPLLSEQRIARAKTMMTPFVLRRKKEQVLQHLPPKSHEVVYCEMLKEQHILYQQRLDEGRKAMEDRLAGIKNPKTVGNLLMELRKASLHPLLFRRIYDDGKLQTMAKEIMEEPVYREANEQYIYEDMGVMNDYELHRLCAKFSDSIGNHRLSTDVWDQSGKIKKLLEIIPEMKDQGDRILLFSQFTQMLDILEVVLDKLGVTFLRLDGQTPVEMRQDLIDKYHEETDITVFLLSTKAGGFGINLACANAVIIYDLSFNPHDDRQAEDRAHRVGQTRPVKIIRLITSNSIEENILALANTKLALDRSVTDESEADKTVKKNEELVAEMLFKDDKPEIEET